MTIHHELYRPARAAARTPMGLLARIVREMAIHDWLVLAYAILLNLVALQVPASAERDAALANVFVLLAALLVTLVCVRGGLLKHRFWAPLIYRVGIYGTVQLSYFMLGGLLPVLNTTTLDLELYQLDLALFGFEPAIAMDAFVTPFATEWFAFFYFGYFFLLAVHVIPILFFSSRPRPLAEFAMGMIVLFCIGHVLYMLVPGYGPYKAIASEFQNEFPSGMWLDLVMTTVASGGAQMDIFPSLHTGGPTFVLLYSFRHRDKAPFRYTWPIVAFFCVNIIIATMFLRWHYVIDVVAGLALAAVALVIANHATRLEFKRRALENLTDPWPAFFEQRRKHTLTLVRQRQDQQSPAREAA